MEEKLIAGYHLIMNLNPDTHHLNGSFIKYNYDGTINDIKEASASTLNYLKIVMPTSKDQLKDFNTRLVVTGDINKYRRYEYKASLEQETFTGPYCESSGYKPLLTATASDLEAALMNLEEQYLASNYTKNYIKKLGDSLKNGYVLVTHRDEENKLESALIYSDNSNIYTFKNGNSLVTPIMENYDALRKEIISSRVPLNLRVYYSTAVKEYLAFLTKINEDSKDNSLDWETLYMSKAKELSTTLRIMDTSIKETKTKGKELKKWKRHY